eukprot:gnl/MRDRNA2_/MRDRNA2_59417_c0_seq1.p1 gnl/MRDRNA2_/MRDRNA2_59417_c0~~gnl/MRDRNA2_/MRDRNA2_59417_c0_seq1.p1  ORF type:complete len:1726 (-),score=278.04 gnl/MRDRNA2_/MRDRNA2_59417_c0_seq1:251-4669(-)
MEADPSNSQPDGTFNRDGVTPSKTFGSKDLNMDIDYLRGGNGQPMWHVLKEDPSWDPCTGIRVYGVWCEGGRVVAITTPFLISRFKRLPEELGLLTDLRVLNFGWVAFFDDVTLPCSMSHMTGLQALIISNIFGADAKITMPGCAVKGLTNLRELVVYNSKLMSLPKELYDLPNLKEIVVPKNEIKQVLTPPVSLEVLVMSQNKLAGDVKVIIGSKLKQRPAIRGIDLQGNQLEGELDADTFDDCPNLEELYLTGSESARCTGQLPRFKGTTNLKVLDLQQNEFSGSIPESWGAMTLVEKLILRGNRIECPNGTLPGLLNKPELKILDLSHNQLMTPPFGIVNGEPLMEVNGLLAWLGPYINPDIEVLDFSNNKLSGTGLSALTTLLKLRTADFSHNALGPGYTYVSNDLESSAYNDLSVFDLSYNNFTRLPDSTNIPAPFLTRLKLDHNPLLKPQYAGRRAPGYFKPEKVLEDGCRITSDFTTDANGDDFCPFICPKWVAKDRDTTTLDIDPVVYGYLGDVEWYEKQFPREKYRDFFGDGLCRCKSGYHGHPPNCVRTCTQIHEYRSAVDGACKPCPLHASCLDTDIICNVGYFRVPGEDRCQTCANGLDCAWKHFNDALQRQSAPGTLPGFWAPPANASWMVGTYTCRDDRQCPGGELGKCSAGRTGIACGKCLENHYVSGNGECAKCEMPKDSTRSLIAVLVTGFVLCGILRVLRASFVTVKLATVGIAHALCLMLTALQSLAAFQRLQVRWPGPFRVVLDALALFNLNFDIIRFQCIVTKDDPLMNYLTKLFVVPVVILAIFGIVAAAKHRGYARMGKNVAINASGMVLSAFFIPICVTSFEPWQCMDNSNGRQTILAMPHVECGSEMHRQMLGLSAAAVFLYPVSFLSVCIFYTITYKKYVMMFGVDFLEKTQFIFSRFKPQNYKFGIIFLFRSFSISVIPVVFVNHVVMQLLLMSVVLLMWTYAELSQKPWRVKLVSMADSVMSFCLLVILLCGALVIDPAANSANDSTSTFLIFFFCSLFLGLLVPIIAGLKKAMSKQKCYDFFLCHHKGGGGAHARWVQMLLGERTNGEIFLDSDCLEDLENIFDMVKSDTKNVVVLLTRETLRRMWCAGEIASAFKNGVNVVKLVCSDFEEFSSTFFTEELPHYFSDEQLAELANGGLSYEDIESAYRRLAELPSVPFPRDGSVADQMQAIKKLMDNSVGLSVKFSDLMPTNFHLLPNLLQGSSPHTITSKCCDKDADAVKNLDKVCKGNSAKIKPETSEARPIVVLGDGLTPETAVSCRILQTLLQRESSMGVDACTVREALTAQEIAVCSSAKCVVVLLTNGLLSNPAAVALMTLLASQDGPAPEFVPCTADRSFCFPSVSFYNDILLGTALSADFIATVRSSAAAVHPQQGPLELNAIADAYKELFTKLSLPFSPQASKDVIDVEVQGLLRRLRSVTAVKSKSSTNKDHESVKEEIEELV